MSIKPGSVCYHARVSYMTILWNYSLDVPPDAMLKMKTPAVQLQEARSRRTSRSGRRGGLL
jgi:hypothetical protein